MNEPPGSELVVKSCQNSRSLSESGSDQANWVVGDDGLAARTAASKSTAAGIRRRSEDRARRGEGSVVGDIAALLLGIKTAKLCLCVTPNRPPWFPPQRNFSAPK